MRGFQRFTEGARARHADADRLTHIERDLAELLALARQNNVAMTDLDDRVADLQEARDDAR